MIPRKEHPLFFYAVLASELIKTREQISQRPDSTLQEIDMYPAELKNSLRQWLETFPDKITFGTDCFPYNDVLGSEESYWLGNISARHSLAATLAEMVSAGEITERKATEKAHAYIHDNALSLYPSLAQ
jgi:uncharacterized protein